MLEVDTSRRTGGGAAARLRWSAIGTIGTALIALDGPLGAQKPVPVPLSAREFPVDVTPGIQLSPEIAVAGNGDYAVVWAGPQGNADIFAQRYAASGAPLGPAFAVNVNTAGDQNNADIAMQPNGDFVVVWNDASGAFANSMARLFAANGTPKTGDIPVSIPRQSDQSSPLVAVAPTGGFAVTWTDTNNAVTGSPEIIARVFTPNGAASTMPFRVNSTIAGTQTAPSVAMDALGNFVVCWEGPEIMAQCFNAKGVPVGGEFQVNTTTSMDQQDPEVAMTPAGDFVVVWRSKHLGGNFGGDIFGQRFLAGGAPAGAEFQVNANASTAGVRFFPDVAVDAIGNFVVTWLSYPTQSVPGGSGSVLARAFDAMGVPPCAELQVNVNTLSPVKFFGGDTAVGMNATGQFVVGWDTDAAPTSPPSATPAETDIAARQYQLGLAAAEVVLPGPNPPCLDPGLTSGPILCQSWDPAISSGCLASAIPGATPMVDVLGIAVLQLQQPLPLPGLGALLIDLNLLVTDFITTPAGTRFSVPVPPFCSLVGVTLFAQGASVGTRPGSVIVATLTDVLQITIGTF